MTYSAACTLAVKATLNIPLHLLDELLLQLLKDLPTHCNTQLDIPHVCNMPVYWCLHSKLPDAQTVLAAA